MVRIFRLLIALTMNPGAEIRKFDKVVIFFVSIDSFRYARSDRILMGI